VSNHAISVQGVQERVPRVGWIQEDLPGGEGKGKGRLSRLLNRRALRDLLRMPVPDHAQGTEGRRHRLRQYVYGIFGLEYTIELSTRPENSIGTEEMWAIATDGLHKPEGLLYILHAGQGYMKGLGDGRPGLPGLHQLLDLGADLFGDDRPLAALRISAAPCNARL